LHCTHRFVVVLQTPDPHWALFVHCTQLLLSGLHTGVVPPHCALERHWTQLPLLQMSLAPLHAAWLPQRQFPPTQAFAEDEQLNPTAPQLLKSDDTLTHAPAPLHTDTPQKSFGSVPLSALVQVPLASAI
jgi:hypothetical protein